ncbi:MAG: S26 family signal peptidase [Planctomycetia bacterium]|nr:S26 family signal peptidase [Planctomycetia bacterium]
MVISLSKRRKFLRITFTGLMGAVILVFLCECFVLRGLLVPLRISGSSMAPTLPGRHFVVVCHHCGFSMTLDAEPLTLDRDPPHPEPLPYADTVRCGECGERINGISDPDRYPVHPGIRVLLDRTAFVRRDPRRFELVALRYPGNPEKLCVKRIVGLPGETVQFRDGNLLIQGRKYLSTDGERARLPRIPVPRIPLVSGRGVTDELAYLRTHAPHIAENVVAVPSDRVDTDSDGHLFRSLVFRKPLGMIESRGFQEPVTSGQDEYFVIGDNQLISEDSRTWKTPVRRSDLCGVVIPFHSDVVTSWKTSGK